jgi:predicted nucleic acid-binding protein
VRRVVADTNVYIDWINQGLHERLLPDPANVKYLSAVVLMELRAGAFSRADLRRLGSLERAFERSDRILTPSARVFREAGDVLKHLQTDRGYDVARSASIANDVLIALSARSIGATVVTRNVRDYEAVRSIRPFKLAAVATEV